jgi:hypothetical protein
MYTWNKWIFKLMKKIYKNIKKNFRINNKFLLLIFIIMSAPIIKKILLIHIFIYLLSWIKFLKIFILKKANKTRFLDKIVLKLIVIYNINKTWKEKTDLIFIVTFGYLIIFFTKCSLKSILISIELYNSIKFNLITKEKNIYLEIFKTVFKEFIIKIENIEQITIFKRNITIS